MLAVYARISYSNNPHFHLSVLQDILEKLRIEKGVDTLTELTKDLHMYPDFHGVHHTSLGTLILTQYTGNRSPIADPRMRGSFVGLELASLHLLHRPFHH
jgi:ribulose kinase